MKARFQRQRGRLGRDSQAPSAPSEVPEGRRFGHPQAREPASRRRAEQRTRRADDFLLGRVVLEARRHLRPLGAALLAFFARIAPPLTSALFALLRLGALAILALTRAGAAVVASLAARVGRARAALWRWLLAEVRPARTYGIVLGVAAVFLGVSQFLHYHGVEVGSRYYEGRAGQVAPAPLTDLEVTGSAHLYVLLPVALLALLLIPATLRGRWQLGRVIGALGLLGLLISLAADVPQGLDAGRAGGAYDSADPELLEGFWIQLCCCAVLTVLGPLLGVRVRGRRDAARGSRRRRLRQSVRPRAEGRGLGSPGGAGA